LFGSRINNLTAIDTAIG